MPTPFYHLRIAEDILNHAGLPEPVRVFLQERRGAFLFGNTAPDVQTVSGQAREATHFFDLPIRPSDPTAWEKLLASFPALSHPESLKPAQSAFLAGYVCHLQADWQWILEIFAPVFGPRAGWGSFSHRLYLHNVLRSYLDREILPGLNHGIAHRLVEARPEGWLPFIQDSHLYTWRDFLAQQLHPGSVIQTVEVFAARQGISPEAYYHMLSSEEEMDQQIFTHLPRQNLVEYRQNLIRENIKLLSSYLGAL